MTPLVRQLNKRNVCGFTLIYVDIDIFIYKDREERTCCTFIGLHVHVYIYIYTRMYPIVCV